MFYRICYCLALLQCQWLRICSSKSTYIGFQLDEEASTSSLLHYKGTFPRLQKFSFCIRWQILQYRNTMSVMSYATNEVHNEMKLTLNKNTIEFDCCKDRAKITLRFDIKLDKKDSMCLGLNLVERYAIAVVNGMLIKTETDFSRASEEALYVKENGSLVFGQDQDYMNGGYNRVQSFRGFIIDFSLINKILTTAEMIKFTNCSYDFLFESKNVVCDFSNIQETFEASNVSVTYKDFDPNFCHSNISFISFIPGLRTFNGAKGFCNSVGGEIVAPRNTEENTNLFNYLNTYKTKCVSTDLSNSWLGIFYNTEGNLEHYNTGIEQSYGNLKAKITHATEKYCMVFYGSDMITKSWYGAWEEKPCTTYKTCVACYFQEPQKLHLRGLCTESVFDRYYYLTVENGTEYFRGEKFSTIKFINSESKNEKLGHWKIYRKDYPLYSAFMIQEFTAHFPIGKNFWLIDDDSCEENYKDLFLTSCESNEFTCNDGSCIPLAKRCDLQLDCFDYSDEIDCLPLILPRNYTDEIPPPKTSADDPLCIEFFFDIYSVKELSLKGFSFVSEMSLTLIWRDSRVSFKNLKDDETLNMIDPKKSIPWLPFYLFEGGQNSSSEISISSSRLNVRRDSSPLPDNDENTIRDEIYLGSENSIVQRDKFTLKTSCQFDLSNFPFDTQICRIYLIPDFPNNGSSVFQPIDEGVTFSGRNQLLEYSIRTPKLLKLSYGSSMVNAIEFRFTSLSSYYISNTYAPTLILLVIGHLPFYFSLDDFSDRIIVAVTALLVEAAFFSQLGEIMPHTSYLTKLDIWCLFCIVIMFLISLLLSIINYVHIQNNKEIKNSPSLNNEDIKMSKRRFKVKAEHVNIFARIFLPVVMLLFLFSYIIAINN